MEYNISLNRYRKNKEVTRISFSSHKECREFINRNPRMIFGKNQIKNLRFWDYGGRSSEWSGVKLGKIIKIKGLSIYVSGIHRLTLRELNLEKILGS